MAQEKKQKPRKVSQVEALRRRVIQAEANLGMARSGEGLSLTRPHSTTGRVRGPQRTATLTRLTKKLTGLREELKTAKRAEGTRRIRAKQKPKHV